VSACPKLLTVSTSPSKKNQIRAPWSVSFYGLVLTPADIVFIQGYAYHVQGTVCEWLMGIFFVIYSLLFLPEFRKFTVHVLLEPLDHNENELAEPGEHSPILEHV